MYIQATFDRKCCNCNSINMDEIVIRDNITYRRCRKCGHESCISAVTTTDSGGTKPTIYRAIDNDKPIEY